MGVVDTKTLAAARRYTDNSIAGGGAIKGKNCTIDSISPITGGNRVTFKWTLDNGTVQTGTMDVMNGEEGAQGPQGIQGEQGADGLGIKSVDINENNHLIITYDDDTTHDAGEIPGGGGTGEVISVNGKKGVVKLYATDIPMSDATGAQTIALEISHLQGSVLSLRTNKADKSDLGTAAYKNVPASGDASNSEVVLGSDSRLTDARNAADVPAWAKAATKPTYTASEVGAVATTDVGSANGIAPLGSDQKVPAANLPSYVDDVLEYSSQSSFPATGESGKIYVDLSTNKTYRWSGTTYVVVGGDLALGETANTAYAGNKGKANADAIDAIKDGTNIDSFADVETALSGKQATISDLATIRSGAEAGATAVQPNDLNNYYSTADTAETTIDDADYFPFYDASATGKRKTLFSSIVDKLKATFQTVSLADFTGDLNTLTTAGYKQYKAKLSDLTNAPTVSYTPMECYIDVWSDTNNIYQAIRIIGLTYSPSAKYSSTFKRSSYNTGSSLSWGAWEQIDGKISITPTPAATITDAALKTAINGAASSENKAASAYAMKKWSNVLTKRYIVEGTSDPSTSPIGTTGIGTWDDSATPDETDWLDIGDLTGIESSDDIDVSLKFDPKSGEAITLGGYIIDTTTGKMCLKFGNTIATPANARVAIDIAFMRNEFGVI